MNTPESFTVLIREMRTGDAQAIRKFVEYYEPYLRRTIRHRLNRNRLQAISDSADVCQSVLGTFMVRFVAGDFEVTNKDDLTKLLLGITKKKMAMLKRRESAQRRDRNRTKSLGSDPQIPDPAMPEPVSILDRLEILSEIQRRIGTTESELFRLRQDGFSWDEIAEKMNEPAARLRKRLSRAIQNVWTELGLELSDD